MSTNALFKLFGDFSQFFGGVCVYVCSKAKRCDMLFIDWFIELSFFFLKQTNKQQICYIISVFNYINLFVKLFVSEEVSVDQEANDLFQKCKLSVKLLRPFVFSSLPLFIMIKYGI